MTPEKLKQIALRLSNSCYVRYWLHFNYPQEDPITMAISVMGESDVRQLDKELTELGFARHLEEGAFDIWTITKTSEAERSKRFQEMMDSIPYYQ